LFDCSVSMKGDRLAAALKGANEFVDGMRPLDQAMVLLFSDRLLRVSEFTEDRDLLAQTLTEVDASIDLLSVGGRPVAAAFGFADEQGYYLYNSAYETALAEAAPGIVLIATMIERSISDGLTRFDFLKGDEQYKYHLGAVERPLSVIEGTFA